MSESVPIPFDICRRGVETEELLVWIQKLCHWTALSFVIISGFLLIWFLGRRQLGRARDEKSRRIEKPLPLENSPSLSFDGANSELILDREGSNPVVLAPNKEGKVILKIKKGKVMAIRNDQPPLEWYWDIVDAMADLNPAAAIRLCLLLAVGFVTIGVPHSKLLIL